MGSKYTWCNGRKVDDRIWERLDRALANQDWKSLFPTAFVTHKTISYSDHNPIFLALDDRENSPVKHRRKGRLFIFETFWLHKAKCGELV